jgi:hypothetical protein
MMGHHGEVGRDGLLRWQVEKMKKKTGKNLWASTEHGPN